MRLGVSQTTTYPCNPLTGDSLCRVRLTPSRTGQKVLSWDLQVADATHQVTFDDHHGNRVQLWSIPKETTEIKILCAGEVETEDRGGVVDRRAGLVPLGLYCRPSERTAADDSILELCREPEVEAADGVLARAHALSRAIHDGIGDQEGGEGGEAAGEAGDAATTNQVHRFMAAGRHLEIPVRFVAGYVLAPPDDAGPETPVTGSHSWAEAWVTGLGWVAFDVINAACADDRYVRLRVGVDAAGAPPITRIGSDLSGEATTVLMENLGSQ